MNLGGSIAPQLSNLDSLGLLFLSSNELSDSIPSGLGDLSSLTSLNLSSNLLSGTIPSSLDNLVSLFSLSNLMLNNNQLNGEIPQGLKSADSSLNTLTLANNHFLPDEMAAFIAGYGTDSNGWEQETRIANLDVSPQNPPYPMGDTVYFSVLTPYIDGLVYSGTAYTGIYEFNPTTDTAIVQDSSRLPSLSLIEDSYNLKTTLSDTSYVSPANTLVFTTTITVVMEVGLNSENKPVDIEQCGLYNAKDNRRPLCYQYFAFNNRSTLSTWDFSQAVADSWHGITVDNSNRVTGLGLNDMNLGGSIAPQLGNLSSLTELYLNGNRLTGSIPPELGNLSSLTSLDLSDNIDSNLPPTTGLTGTIPSSLGDLSTLDTLDLGNNELTEAIPAELGNLSSLRILRLDGNQLSDSIPSQLGNLSSLTGLHLDGNNLSGAIPSELGNLSALDTLDLGNNELTEAIPAELGNLSSLRILRLDGNQLSDSIPSELGNLPSLTGLHLDDNELSGTIPPSLGKLSTLISLTLSNNDLRGSIPPNIFSSTTQTLNFSMQSNQLSGSIPERWKSLNFFFFALDLNHFSPDDMASFVGGYGTNSNGWTEAKVIGTFVVSPQTPPYPGGDTLYFSTIDPYIDIDRFAYKGQNDTVSYTAEYEFTRKVPIQMAIVQDSLRLPNPLEGGYSLKATLTTNMSVMYHLP